LGKKRAGDAAECRIARSGATEISGCCRCLFYVALFAASGTLLFSFVALDAVFVIGIFGRYGFFAIVALFAAFHAGTLVVTVFAAHAFVQVVVKGYIAHGGFVGVYLGGVHAGRCKGNEHQSN
jgi:hypothetical protein